MTPDEMRVAISKVYAGKKWKYKVDRMPDYQVIAIYFSFLESGKFNKKPAKKEAPPPEPSPFKPYVGVQLTMFD